VGTYPVGSTVLVDENVPATYQVDHITSTPPTAIVSSSVNLAAGSVSVVIAPGVTQVVYTNKRI
ncbi:MAG: hypothetical protein QOE57_3087, partial [Acidimicrobiaceae bacterium]|nr:hypothetical protein [Acidimicrobiaceae bacterium]